VIYSISDMSFKYEDVEKIYKKIKNLKQRGKNADYIPDLIKVDPNIYAISVCNIKGEVMNFGDYRTEVGIESASKVFTLALALNMYSIKKLISHIGDTDEKREFNSIKDVVEIKNHTINSFVNAGAMATTSLLYDKTKSHDDNEKAMNKIILKNMEDFAGRTLKVNEHLYLSEYRTSHHNELLIDKLVSYNRFYGDPQTVLKSYTKQCSVMVTSKDIAVMAATLANNGKNPITHKKLINEEKVEYIIDHMAEHGLYNESTKWWEKTHFPAKSGVGGVIMIVIPGIMGIGIVSPPLNKYGNSFKGVETGKLLAKIPIY
jgi:glutaminase